MWIFVRLIGTVVEPVTQRRWKDTSFTTRAHDHSLDRTLNRRYMAQSFIIADVIFLLLMRELSENFGHKL